MRTVFLLGPMLATILGTTASAQQARQPSEIDRLATCRSITAAAERLACYDEAVGQLQRSIDTRKVVVVDREHIRRTKRSLFGLTLPDLNLFGGREDSAEDVKSIEGLVGSARRDEDSRWIVSLQDGAVWRQIDDRPLALAPRQGAKVVVVQAALGSYMMRIGGQPGIRVRRLR